MTVNSYGDNVSLCRHGQDCRRADGGGRAVDVHAGLAGRNRPLLDQRPPQGFDENQRVARRGGNVAGVARKALEAETGKPVVTSQNAESFRQLVTDIVTDAAQLPENTEENANGK